MSAIWLRDRLRDAEDVFHAPALPGLTRAVPVKRGCVWELRGELPNPCQDDERGRSSVSVHKEGSLERKTHVLQGILCCGLDVTAPPFGRAVTVQPSLTGSLFLSRKSAAVALMFPARWLLVTV